MPNPMVGEIRLFAFDRAPAGWLLCDGRKLSIHENIMLFNLIETTYGGDGSQTFAVPDLRGRVPLHHGHAPGMSRHSLGDIGGHETVALKATHLPAHTHTLQVASDLANEKHPKGHALAAPANNDKMYAEPDKVKNLVPVTTAFSSTSSAGGGKRHDNMMPTSTLSYCICVSGNFP